MQRLTWFFVCAALVGLGCAKKPGLTNPGTASKDTSQTGGGTGDLVTAPDVPALSDTPAAPDAPGTVDVPVLDGSPVVAPDATSDTPPPPPDEGPGPDLTGPKVVSAFSADGQTVTVRFSEPVDAASGADVSNFTIKGSDNTDVKLTGATVDGRYVRLALLDPTQVDSALDYTCYVKTAVKDLAGNGLDPTKAKSLVKRTVYLAIIWHQHQPLYYDATKDELSGPWVRKHATKDYYDMASILAGYPDVHLTINLTSVLLRQLDLYNQRLLPFVDKVNNTVDEAGFLAQWKGKTDPFVDFLLEDTPAPETATQEQIGLLYDNPWATVSTSDATMSRWPEYVELRDKNPKLLTQEDFLKLKLYFELAWFDPDFLVPGGVKLPTGTTVDLSDLVQKGADGKFTLKVPPSEALANRLVAENAKIIEAVVPIHKQLMYDFTTSKGQIEITMTPFYHPILPLVHDTNQAKIALPFDKAPDPAFSFPDDAEAQVLKSKAQYETMFGLPPQGTWCGEGSVAEAIVGTLKKAGLRWTATDAQVLTNSTPGGQAPWFAYRVDADTEKGDAGSHADEMTIVFRNTQMSNDIGFKFQTYSGKAAAEELIGNVLAQAPKFGGQDRLITLIVDGENAWEEYRVEHDGKGFHHALYAGLAESFEVGELVTVTPTEYIDGNADRAVPAHPTAQQPELEPLWAGSWIDGTYGIWIGENEENVAWSYLLQARNDLAASGIPRPNPEAPEPADVGSKAWNVYAAWEAIYAAEGSDWFWWYGDDMTTPANDDTPFDQGFRAQLAAMYQFTNAARAADGKPPIAVPDFKPIIQAKPQPPSGPFPAGGEPVLDGALVPNESEWTTIGGFFKDNDSGAQANQDDDIQLLYYGYTPTHFYLAIVSSEDLQAKQGTPYELAVYFSHKHVVDAALGTVQKDPANGTTRHGSPLEMTGGLGGARELRLDFAGGKPKAVLSKADGKGGWTAVSGTTPESAGPAKQGKVLELRVAWSDLNLAPSDPLEIVIAATQGGKDLDLAPTLGSKTVFDDATNVVYVTFQCDVTGKQVPVDTYTTLKTYPPPKDKGVVYITGNVDKLLQWTPNKIAMLDDGKAPDAVANDGLWTLTVALPPGTLLRYKYTVGLPKDEGKWSGTEEFPLTERGLDVTKDPTKKKMKVSDVFADRPQPSGTQAKKTTVELLE